MKPTFDRKKTSRWTIFTILLLLFMVGMVAGAMLETGNILFVVYTIFSIFIGSIGLTKLKTPLEEDGTFRPYKRIARTILAFGVLGLIEGGYFTLLSVYLFATGKLSTIYTIHTFNGLCGFLLLLTAVYIINWASKKLGFYQVAEKLN